MENETLSSYTKQYMAQRDKVRELLNNADESLKSNSYNQLSLDFPELQLAIFRLLEINESLIISINSYILKK